MRAHFLPVAVVAVLLGCESTTTTPPEPPVLSLDAQLRRNLGGWGIVPIGPMSPLPAAQVELGRMLFFDKILSGNRDVACATCHDPAKGLGDGFSLAVGTGANHGAAGRSLGAGRQFTPRSAPSLLNAGIGLPYLFWDARLARSGFPNLDPGVAFPADLDHVLAKQATLPILNRREMRGEKGDRDAAGQANELAAIDDAQHAAIWEAAMRRLLAIQEYVDLFKAAFPGEPAFRFSHAAKAIAAFEMATMIKTRSPFDRYLDRDDGALTVPEKRGGILFFEKARCASCHNGPFLGAQSFANVGAPQIGPGGSREPPRDLGRGELDQNEFYRFAFRVAPLRNVELTAPYFHSGAYSTLEAVVKHYDNVAKALRTFDPTGLAPELRPLYRGDAATVDAILQRLDGRLRDSLGLSDPEISDLVAFLESLTDPAARNLRALIPSRVPSGLPVDN